MVVVVFRLTVFRPFPSETILAKVKSSDEDGIQRMSLVPLPKGLRMIDVCSIRRVL